MTMTTERFAYSPTALRTLYNWLLMGLPILMLIGIILFLATITADSDTSFHEALAYTEEGRLDWHFIALVTTSIVALAVLLLVKQGRISLDDQGLQFYMPPASGAGWLGLTTGSHQVPWDQVRSFRTESPDNPRNLANGLARARLVIETDRGEYSIQPYHYYRLDGPDHRMNFQQMLRKPEEHLDSLLANAPLVQAVRERVGETGETDGIAGEKPPVELPVGATYNLLHHKGMLVQLGLLTLLGGYALVDFLMLTEYSMVGAIPVLPFAASALAAAALSLPLGRGAPFAERAGVAALVVAAALAATYPGLMRHALFTVPEPDTLAYESTATAVFEHPEAPKLDFQGRNLDAFWEEAAATGDSYKFRIHSAETGVQVLDMRPIHAQTRVFYQARSEE
ncbi:MAG: hypothetical protein R6W87_12410 [Halospina sp.]